MAYGTGSRIGRTVRDSVRGTTRRAVTALPGIGPVIAPVTSQGGRVAVRDFIDGLGGNPRGGVAVPVKAVPRERQQGGLTRGLAQVRAAAPVLAAPLVPQERMSAFLDTMLRGPLTLREAQAASNMLPAPAKPRTASDVVLGETAKLSQQIYADQIAQATEMAKTDPDAARDATARATDAYFARQAGLVGFNPLQLAQAELMNQPEE